jgi:hypothetical protein
VKTRIGGKIIKLHHFFLKQKDGYVVDHIDRNKLNNKKQNLRYITTKENTWNTVKPKGYYFEKRRNKYIVRIFADGKTMHSEAVETEREAIELYSNLKKQYHTVATQLTLASV